MPEDDKKSPSEPPPKDGKGEHEPAQDEGPLSAEEQMARFEKALKDEDWGHQPC
jgi:hypothetical protein